MKFYYFKVNEIKIVKIYFSNYFIEMKIYHCEVLQIYLCFISFIRVFNSINIFS